MKHSFTLLGILALAIIFLPSFSKADTVINGKARLAFVNNGMLVVMNDSGQLSTTSIRCLNPSISRSGYKIVYTASELLPKMIILKTYGKIKYGVATKDTGICMLNLQTGQVTQLTQTGDSGVLSPDETNLAYISDEKIKILNIKAHTANYYSAGSNPVWLDSNTIVFENNLQVYKAALGGKPDIFFILRAHRYCNLRKAWKKEISNH